jgi:maltose alpha-D-glucosyltransferase/alpha-amylase
LRRVAANADELAALRPFAYDWEAEARAAFLKSYDAVAGGAGLYESLQPARGALGLFELEKALYELRYELDHRPEWVSIPLQGILGIVRADDDAQAGVRGAAPA